MKHAEAKLEALEAGSFGERESNIPELPPILIEFTDDRANIMYSHKEGRRVASILRHLGLEATPPVLLCHNCQKTFKTRKALNKHKETCELG